MTAVLVALSLALVPLVAARVAGPDEDLASAGRAAALPRCTIIGTQASETLIGTSGDDIICALGGDDVVRGRGGDDVLFGSFGDDVLEGGPGRDELKGHWGADRLNGGGGNDLLHGGGDPDVFSGGDGADIVEYGTRSGSVRVSIGSGGADDGSPGESDRVRGDVERIGGGAGADRLVGNGKGNRLYGRGGNDRLKGGKGDDKLWGGRGVDHLDGRDSGSFTDALDCGAGRPDAALANAGDRVASNCENVTQPKPPAPEENRAPTDLTLSNESVAENQPVGTVVGTLAAADRDAGDDHRFTLAAGSGDDDNAAFTIGDGRLRTAAVFDFEAKSRYSIRVRVTDGNGGSFEKALAITVTDVAEAPPGDVDDPPTAVNDSATVGEDSAAGAIDVLANDTDPDGGTKTIASVTQPANGTVVITGSGTGLTYEPDPDFCSATPDTFTYTLNGGSTATVSITVTCAEDLPTAVDDSATVPEDSAATPLAVLANDTDADGDPMTIASASDPANGTVVLTGGLPGVHTGLTYQPDPSYCSATPDTFTYTLNGGSTATVSVTVTCGDDAPAAVSDTATVPEDSAAGAIDVLANDTDSDGGPMTVASASDPANGTVVLTGGSPGARTGLTYQPDPNYCSATPDTFTYTLNGGSTATVSVTVTCVDDPPTAVNDSATVAEDSAATAIDVLANDTDPDGGPKSIASVTQPANGAVVITGGGTGLTYQPGPNFCSATPDTLTYTLNGGSTATVSVTVTCVDDNPAAVDDSATVPEDSAATPLDVLANDTDFDGGSKTIASASDPVNGTVALTGGLPGAHTGLTYQPDPSYCNSPPGTTPDTFTYTLNGGSTATVSVTVTCGDDAPTAVNDTATVPEDSAAGAIDVLANDTDTDGGPKTIASASDPANGTVVLTGGSPGAHTGLTYRPDPNYCSATPDTFTYTLNGGSTATVSVTVTCVEDPPTAVNDSATVGEDSAAGAVDVLANDTDPDGGTKTIASASDPANGTVALTGGSAGAHTGLTYLPDANYCGPDTFTYTVNGGSTATVSMTVTCAPDNPVVDTSAGNTSYTENAAATVIDAAVTVSDPDAGTTITGATVQITGNPAGVEDILALAGTHTGITATFSGTTLTLTGTASIAAYQSALRDVTYRNSSDAPSTADRTITFTVTDDTSRTGFDTKGITVSAVDDPPTAVNDSATVLEDAAATAVTVLTNDTDLDAGPKSIASVTQPANGTVVITGGGTGLTYQPNPNYCNNPPGTTPSTFTYTLNGGSTATVSVTVTCVNDAPVADDETFNGANGAIGNTSLVVNAPGDGAPALSSPKKSITGDILAGDSDIDGPGPLTVTAGTFATNDGGSVTIEADGDFTYINDPADNCADTSDFFDYTVSDGNAASPGPTPGTDTGRVTIAIAGCVWYVNNNDASGNSGSSTAPFDTLAQAETASAAGDTVFVFDGDNTSTGYGGDGYAMNANERLIGEVTGLVVGGDTLAAPKAGARPTITANNGDVVDLDDNTQVRGFEIDPQGTGGGIAGSSGDTGGGTIDDVNILDAGTAGTQPGLELNSTTGTFTVSNLVVSTNGATGVRLHNTTTPANAVSAVFSPASQISITSANAKGLDVTGTVAVPVALGTSTFDDITVTGSSTGGVNLTSTTGTTNLGDGTGSDLSLTTTSGTAPAFALANAGTITVPSGGTADVSATGGPAVDVTGTGGASLPFDAVSSTGSANDGINLDGLGTGTFSAASGSIGGAAGIAFDLNGGSGNISYPGALNNGTGATADISGRSGGTVALSGAIADANDAGGGITLSANTGGTTTFSNASKVLNTGASDAVSFTNSDGHTLNLTGGGLDIDTTSGQGLVATTSGTLAVSGTGNTLDTTTGRALNVSATDFAAAGATFQNISANGAANGIVLNNTGSAGSLTVTGSGSSAQGGDNSGGTIQGTTSFGISLTNTTGVSLRNMRILNTGDSGVNGTQTSGFSFTNGTITGAGDASDENSITFDDSLTSTPNLTGAVTITNNVISQTEAEGVDIENWAGTISDANISNNALSDTGDVATPGSAITLIGSGVATAAANITRATVANNTITDFRAGVGVQVRAGNPTAGAPTGSAGTAGNATNVIAVTGNAMNGGNAGVGNQPDRFFTGGVSGNGGQGNFNVSNNGTAANRLRNIDCIAIEMQVDGPVTMTSTVQNNFINANSAVGCAGIAVGTDDPNDLGAGTHSTLISNNNVMGTNGPGIFPIVRDSGSTMTARVLNNTVTAPNATNAARAGIRVDSGSAQGDTTMCLELSGNTTAGSTNIDTGTTSPGINLRKQGTDPAVNTFGVEGMAATASPGVENYVNGLNTSTTGTFGTGGTALLSAQSGFTNCNAP